MDKKYKTELTGKEKKAIKKASLSKKDKEAIKKALLYRARRGDADLLGTLSIALQLEFIRLNQEIC